MIGPTSANGLPERWPTGSKYKIIGSNRPFVGFLIGWATAGILLFGQRRNLVWTAYMVGSIMLAVGPPSAFSYGIWSAIVINVGPTAAFCQFDDCLLYTSPSPRD